MTFKISNEDGEYNGALTILIGSDTTKIEIKDRKSSLVFCRIELCPQQLVELLSRRAETPCNIELNSLDRVGKQMIMDNLVFEVPRDLRFDRCKNQEELERLAKQHCPDGWSPDSYFGSQNSFFEQNEKTYARTRIRRWE